MDLIKKIKDNIGSFQIVATLYGKKLFYDTNSGGNIGILPYINTTLYSLMHDLLNNVFLFLDHNRSKKDPLLGNMLRITSYDPRNPSRNMDQLSKNFEVVHVYKHATVYIHSISPTLSEIDVFFL